MLIVFVSCSGNIENSTQSKKSDNTLEKDNLEEILDGTIEQESQQESFLEEVSNETFERKLNEESELREISNEILEKENRRHNEKINKIAVSVEKIDKVILSSSYVSSGESYDLITTDADIILKWIELIKKLEINTIPFEPVAGNGYSLEIYINDSLLNVGGFVGRYLYIDGENNMRVMHIIENYNDLRESFEELQKEMEFPKSE